MKTDCLRCIGWRLRLATPAAAAIAAVSLLWTGCQTTEPPSETAAQKEEVLEALPSRDVPRAEMLDETALNVEEIAPKGPEAIQELDFPEREATERPPAPEVGKYPSDLIKGLVDPEEMVPVEFNFDAMPLGDIVKVFSGLLEFDYLIDPELKGGAVTMSMQTEMTAREVWQLFERVLWLSGAYASPSPGLVHIMPFQKMPQERRLLMKHKPHANVEVAFIPIRHTDSAEVLKNIQPFLTQGATAQNLTRTNSLLLVEAPANMPKLRALIDELDSKGEAGWPHIALQCHKVDAEVIRDELTALLPVLGVPVSKGMPSKGQVKVAALPRVQVIVASAPLRDVLNEVKRWVQLLDHEDANEQENLYFYNVRHSTADHLTEALETFFGESSVTTRQTSKSKATSAKATAPGSRSRRSSSSSARRSGGGESGQSASIFETPIAVYADNEQNRLTVRTTQRAYIMIEALLRRLDVPIRQVAIQAYIAEITLNDSTEYGFAYAAAQQWGDYLMKHAAGHASGAFSDPKSIITASPAGRGFSFLFKHGEDEDKLAFVRAVAGEQNVKILSAPQIVAASDEEAVINVGSQVPIITGSTRDDDDDDFSDFYQDIEYKDTGIILTVTPHITAGNEVRLEVEQEVSNIAEASAEARVLSETPTISKKHLKSTLIVPDGGTVLMGGLIKTQTDNGHSGIPLIKDIPLLGRLFRTNIQSEGRNELLVLISVNVIQGKDATQRLLERYETALKEIREKMKL